MNFSVDELARLPGDALDELLSDVLARAGRSAADAAKALLVVREYRRRYGNANKKRA